MIINYWETVHEKLDELSWNFFDLLYLLCLLVNALDNKHD